MHAAGRRACLRWPPASNVSMREVEEVEIVSTLVGTF
jgi:hypothetical protein